MNHRMDLGKFPLGTIGAGLLEFVDGWTAPFGRAAFSKCCSYRCPSAILEWERMNGVLLHVVHRVKCLDVPLFCIVFNIGEERMAELPQTAMTRSSCHRASVPDRSD